MLLNHVKDAFGKYSNLAGEAGSSTCDVLLFVSVANELRHFFAHQFFDCFMVTPY